MLRLPVATDLTQRVKASLPAASLAIRCSSSFVHPEGPAARLDRMRLRALDTIADSIFGWVRISEGLAGGGVDCSGFMARGCRNPSF